MTTTVLVDAENVRRSRWPNVSQERLVELCRAWAAAHGARTIVVFDGKAPPAAADEQVTVVGTGSESADDWLVRTTQELRERGEPFWLVTSDRALRAAARAGAERVIGGGSFLNELLALG